MTAHNHFERAVDRFDMHLLDPTTAVLEKLLRETARDAIESVAGHPLTSAQDRLDINLGAFADTRYRGGLIVHVVLTLPRVESVAAAGSIELAPEGRSQFVECAVWVPDAMHGDAFAAQLVVEEQLREQIKKEATPA